MPRWTEQARQKQSEQIQVWQPWQNSTGPRSPHGKQMSSGNRRGTGDPRRIQMLAALGLLKCLKLEQELKGFLDKQALEDQAFAKSVLEKISAGGTESKINELFKRL